MGFIDLSDEYIFRDDKYRASAKDLLIAQDIPGSFGVPKDDTIKRSHKICYIFMMCYNVSAFKYVAGMPAFDI